MRFVIRSQSLQGVHSSRDNLYFKRMTLLRARHAIFLCEETKWQIQTKNVSEGGCAWTTVVTVGWLTKRPSRDCLCSVRCRQEMLDYLTNKATTSAPPKWIERDFYEELSQVLPSETWPFVQPSTQPTPFQAWWPVLCCTVLPLLPSTVMTA